MGESLQHTVTFRAAEGYISINMRDCWVIDDSVQRIRKVMSHFMRSWKLHGRKVESRA
jgi:hypothetical protein